MSARQRWSRDVRRAVEGRPGFRVFTSRGNVAAALWDFGEDDLAERAARMADDELAAIERISAVYEDPGLPLPVISKRITHDHVAALAAVAYFEGRLRPLARDRRRPARHRPAHLAPAPPEPGRGLG